MSDAAPGGPRGGRPGGRRTPARARATDAAPTSPDPRALALRLLAEVLDRGRSLDEALTRAGLEALAPRDRSFVRALVGATLRHLLRLEAVLVPLLERPEKLPDGIVHLLRLGAAQLLVLGTPPHAAVATSVALAPAAGGARLAGLVNAVLRRLDSEGRAPFAEDPEPGRTATPPWLWARWVAAYGTDAALATAATHLEAPPLDLSVRSDAAGWAARLGGTVLPTGGVRLREAGPVPDLEGYAEGGWWVQDAAASLPARLLGDVRGRRVFDLCAAPGGKTAQLAAAGAQVVAVDKSPSRLGRLRENLARLSLAAEAVAADLAQWRPDTQADAVLLDAPCTATGTIRRHPDVLHAKRPEDLGALAGGQALLLARAADLVRPGGTLVYAVCSLEPEEGEAQIDRFLAQDGRFVRDPITDAAALGLGPESVSAAGDLRTLPGHWHDRGGLDGFFAARLRRAS